MQTDTERLSSEFSRILREWLTTAEMEEINTLNEDPKNEGYCGSHQFCDPNEAILQAFNRSFGREADLANMNDTNMMNEAWGISKTMKFLN